MKITVFGGGGFIGSTIVDRLLLDGHSIEYSSVHELANIVSFFPMKTSSG
jgi:nucleoside-diphosphate-sugar epimerase